MTFKPTAWFAAAVSALNIGGLGFALGTGEPGHATAHAVLALALGGFAVLRLRQGSAAGERRTALEGQAGLEALEAEMDNLRQELIDAQDRLDFAERMLAQGAESRKIEPER